MANVVVGAAPATNVVEVTQTGISASSIVQSTETRGTITVNAAVDVDSSDAPNDSLLIWNSNTSRYELRAFTDLPIDAGTM
ncbi:uncharacterized protein METZ01_LOCUS300904 [marine metagenome]|uniref:Uncharacterized protein n=1 Tax=marine metagenome TaxID=408172 RepID=A0A382MHD0_9ZZZZ